MTGFQAGQQEAAAKADVLARATINAKRPITDYTEAIEINRKAAAALALQYGQSANPIRESNIALAGWQRELREVRKEGNMEALNADLKTNMLTMEQLSIKYGISTQALDYYKKKLAETVKEQAAQTEALKRAQVEQEKFAKSVRDYYNWVGSREIEHAAEVQAATERQAAALRAFYNEMGVLEMNAWKPEPIVNWIETIEDIAPAVEKATDAVRGLGAATGVPAGPTPTVGGNVAGMAPTWSQNLVPKYGAGGYLGTGAPISITINGSVLGNKDEIARVVGDAVTSSLQAAAATASRSDGDYRQPEGVPLCAQQRGAQRRHAQRVRHRRTPISASGAPALTGSVKYRLALDHRQPRRSPEPLHLPHHRQRPGDWAGGDHHARVDERRAAVCWPCLDGRRSPRREAVTDPRRRLVRRLHLGAGLSEGDEAVREPVGDRDRARPRRNVCRGEWVYRGRRRRRSAGAVRNHVHE